MSMRSIQGYLLGEDALLLFLDDFFSYDWMGETESSPLWLPLCCLLFGSLSKMGERLQNLHLYLLFLLSLLFLLVLHKSTDC